MRKEEEELWRRACLAVVLEVTAVVEGKGEEEEGRGGFFRRGMP